VKRVLFVCTGNICRSPTAEAVFRRLVEQSGLAGRIGMDSAGTHGYHIGEPPDPRTQAAARARGYDLSGLRARRIAREDFSRFDLVIAMDRDHHALLRGFAPPTAGHKLRMFMEFARRSGGEDEVPDPYYGGPDGFELVLNLIEDAAEGLLDHLRAELESPADG
jgi:protein-tyrosine phosphatase